MQFLLEKTGKNTTKNMYKILEHEGSITALKALAKVLLKEPKLQGTWFSAVLGLTYEGESGVKLNIFRVSPIKRVTRRTVNVSQT